MTGNTTSRYPFAPIRDGAFLFVTDGGCYYTIIVSASHQKFDKHELLFNNGECFEISIQRDCDEERAVFDPTVSNTILHILTTNIAAKGDTATFFYACDPSEGSGPARSRIFKKWHKLINNELPLLELYDFVVPNYDEDPFHISLLIFSNHPRRVDYIKNFQSILNDEFAKG